MLFGKNPLQLGQRQIGTVGKRSQQARPACPIHAADRTMPLLDAIRLTTLALLPADLLHPTQAHPEPLCQRSLRALARRIRCQELPSQIIIVGSRHTLRGVHQGYLIVTLEML